MKVGIIGAGAVGAASLLSLVMRGPPACEIVVLDKNYARAKGVVAGSAIWRDAVASS
jgi:L-lactate dehydrogenase